MTACEPGPGLGPPSEPGKGGEHGERDAQARGSQVSPAGPRLAEQVTAGEGKAGSGNRP